MVRATMVYAYYSHLTEAQKRIYRRSDRVTSLPFPEAESVRETVMALAETLRREDRAEVEALARRLIGAMTARFRVTPLQVAILEVRPSSHWGELHGLYTPAERGKPPRVTLWMRTAKRRQVVKFKTFLRTLIHELCHHLDYELLRLGDSFHTEGFYKRESSLLHQVLGDETAPVAPVTGSRRA